MSLLCTGVDFICRSSKWDKATDCLTHYIQHSNSQLRCHINSLKNKLLRNTQKTYLHCQFTQLPCQEMMQSRVKSIKNSTSTQENSYMLLPNLINFSNQLKTYTFPLKYTTMIQQADSIYNNASMNRTQANCPDRQPHYQRQVN